MLNKVDMSGLIQLLIIIGSGFAAWSSLTTDMALIKREIELSSQGYVVVNNRLREVEDRIETVESVQRDLWNDLRRNRDGRGRNPASSD